MAPHPGSPAVEELIDVAGRVTIEAVLKLSAQQVAGEPSVVLENSIYERLATAPHGFPIQRTQPA
jgi:hypothetical protein